MSCQFHLTDDDFQAIEVAGKLARSFLQRPDMTPRAIIGLGNALFALERLPKVTSGVHVEFGIVYRSGDDTSSEMRYLDFHISEGAFEISRGGSVYDQSVGSDSYSSPGWRVEVGGYRSTECEIYEIENELQELLNLGACPTVTCESCVDLDEVEERDENEGDEDN